MIWLLGIFLFVASGVAAFGQVTVPLKIVTHPDSGEQGIGVYLKIGTSPTSQFFVFDTGSQPLIVNSTATLPASSVATGQTSKVDYGINGKSSFDFETYEDTVYFSDESGSQLATVPSFLFGRTTSGKPGGDDYDGIMGAGTAAHHCEGTMGTPNFYLFSIMGKVDYPSGVMPGFTIRLDPNTNTGTLTIGVTPAQWNEVPIKLPMAPKSPSSPDFAPEIPSYGDDQLNVQSLFAGRPGGPAPLYGGQPQQVKIDSGYAFANVVLPRTAINRLLDQHYLAPKGTGSYSILAGTKINIFNGNEPGGFTVPITNKTKAASGDVDLVGTGSYLHVNTGIQPFMNYAITFLLAYPENGGYAGYVGLQPIGSPNLWIDLESKRSLRTSHRKIRISGAAAGEAAKVRWRPVSSGKWRVASGVGLWSFRSRLKPGKNAFVVEAVSTSGVASRPARVIVRRKAR